MAAAARVGAAAADPLRAELADIAPLFDLYAQYSEALYKQRRYARARSLATRLLAAVEAAQALPADSLVLAVALRCVLVTRMLPVEGELGDSFEARLAVWRADPAGTLALSQRCAALLAARAAARKLFTLTPHEGAWMHMAQSVRYATLSVDTLLVMSAMEALTYWPGERFRGGLGISPELRTLLAAAIPALVEAFAHGYSMACDAAKSVYHPVVAQECFPVGIFAERCRFPDVARYANTMCDAACLKALYIRLLGSQSYPSGKVALLPPHLRFLIHDSNEESKLARFVFMTGEKVTLSAAKISSAEAELAAAQQRMEPLLDCMRKVKADQGKGRVLQQRAGAEAVVQMADASQPPDSLVLAHALVLYAEALDTPLEPPTSVADATKHLGLTWSNDRPSLQARRRCGAILVGRCNMHTLLLASPDEEAWLQAEAGRSPLYLLSLCAFEAARYWPPALREPGAEGATLIVAALRALVRAHVHDYNISVRRIDDHVITCGTYALSISGTLFEILHMDGLMHVVGDAVDRQALSTVGNALFELAVDEKAFANADEELTNKVAQNAARLTEIGLHPCALPSCGAIEPHPVAYKRCDRCKQARYCSKEHQLDDWKRHRRKDGCGRNAAEKQGE